MNLIETQKRPHYTDTIIDYIPITADAAMCNPLSHFVKEKYNSEYIVSF